MARFSVTLERWRDTDMALVRSVDFGSPATNKVLVQPINYEMLIGSHLPEQYRHDAGALCALLLERAEVRDISVWTPDSQTHWIADATLQNDRLRRGIGATPVEALVKLIRALYAY